MNKTKLKDLYTYVYIDSSNIKNALKVSHRQIDWKMLFDYLKNTYKNLKVVNYFEGIDKADMGKTEEFKNLEKYGYKIKKI